MTAACQCWLFGRVNSSFELLYRPPGFFGACTVADNLSVADLPSQLP